MDALSDRAERTVALLADRGFAVSADRLAALLLGGPAPPAAVRRAVRAHPGLGATDGFVHPTDRADLVPPSRRRAQGHDGAADRWMATCRGYVRDLVRHCPWIEAVLVSGSLASGGFRDADDIDVSLVVEEDAKYLTYVAALTLSLPYAWRHRRKPTREASATPLVPKVICVNAVWTRAQTRPFVRQDAAMGLELLFSRPVHGARTWRAVLEHPGNAGLRRAFPQLAGAEPLADVEAGPSVLSRVLDRLTARPGLRRALDNACYLVARALHGLVRWTRRDNPRARVHAERMAAVKHPYAILERPRKATAAPDAPATATDRREP